MKDEFEYILYHNVCHSSCLCYILNQLRRQIPGQSTFVLLRLGNLVFSYTLFFYKNIFYKNIEAEICEILRIF